MSPQTPADSAANQITAYFCSSGSNNAALAYFLVDLPAGGHGKMKVVALDPTDSTRVIESNEATFNGGIEGDYAPVILSATSTHATAELRVSVIGADLAFTSSLQLGAADNLWSLPLAITSKSAGRLTAVADVPTLLPAGVLLAASAFGSGEAALVADPLPQEAAFEANADTIFYRDPDSAVYPHDFAFFYNSVPNPTDPMHPWKGTFHLFYIRDVKATAQDSIIAHAWCDTLGAPWSYDLNAFRPSGQGWDAKKVWAPSIQQVGNRTYMFYAGVDSAENQSLGYAWTEQLGTTNITWHRQSVPMYTAFNTDWADTIGDEVPGVIGFRDPFVMPDPTHSGRYLMFNCGEDRNYPGFYTIGVARNVEGTFDAWLNGGHYVATDHQNLPLPSRVESPLVVQDSLTGAWRMFVTNADYTGNGYDSMIFLTQTAGDTVTDTRAASWPERDSLYAYLGNDANVAAWEAMEHLQIGRTHFFAAYEGPDGIGITRAHWDSTAHRFFIVHPTTASVGPDKHVGVRFYLAGVRPASNVVTFAIESATTIAPRITVYDLAGRQVGSLGDGRPMLGRREIDWDCRGSGGQAVASGIYFARLTGAGTARVVRVPIIR